MRRLLLAIWLLVGLVATAAAQAPGPVPALPDTERRTELSLTAQTGPFNVNFALYGDGTDFGNWVQVYLNGILQSSSTYTITSPSGAVGSIARPITDAQITFNASTTGTVEIVGARRPRRTSQFTENRGVAARDLNQVITDLVAQNRETWDRRARTIAAPPGETLSTLPPKSTRAGLWLGFDVNGDIALGGITPGITTVGTGLQNVAGTLSIANTGVTAATYGDASHSPQCAINAQGQATSCSNVAITPVAISALAVASNLSDLANAATARTNLGVAIGTNVEAWDADLDAAAALACTGGLTRTAANTWTCRTIAGTTNRLTVTNGDGVAGAPTIDISASYAGQNTITTLGTVTTGAWNGTAVGVTYGGTGANLSATGGARQFVKQSTAGGALTVGQPDFADLSGSLASTQIATTTITALTAKASPDTVNDYLILYDNAGAAIKKVSVGAVATAATSGVSSLGGATGAISLGTGLTMATSTLGWDASAAVYTPGGTGAVSTTIKKGFDYLPMTAASFGVKCDGTDEHVAIQAFVTAAGASPYRGGILNGTTGGAVCGMGTTALTIPAYTEIVGGSPQTTLKWSSNINGAIQPVAGTASNVILRDLIIDGTTPSATGIAVYTSNGSGWTLDHVQLNNWETGLLVSGQNYNRVIAGSASNGTTAYRFNNGNSNVLFGCRTNGFTVGVKDSGNNNSSHGCDFEQMSTGVELDSGSVGYASVGDRYENAGGLLGTGTGFQTLAGAVGAYLYGPYLTGLSAKVSDGANALLNSNKEYTLNVSLNPGTVAANSTWDSSPITTAPMNNCVSPSEVTVAPNGSALGTGIMAMGMYASGAVYVRLANPTTAGVAPGALNYQVTCRFRG